MSQESNQSAPRDGLRERKRRETAKRIKEAGVRLFVAKGYDATTLDDIAAEAGISRRTFFYYYKSKDDILLTMQNGMGEILAAAVKAEPGDKSPLHAVRDAAIKISAPVPTDEILVLDRLMRSSEAVQARKAASYLQHEEKLFAALREKWPDPERETALRLVALVSIGAMRLSLDALNRHDGARPLVDLVREAFEAIDAAR